MLTGILADKESTLIESMRFPLMVLVVFIHTIPEIKIQLPENFSGSAIYIFVSESISHVIGRIAVPCFFIFSGYFFFLKSEQYNVCFFRKQLSKRLKTVVIPYFLWNLLTVLITMSKVILFSVLQIDGNESNDIFSLSPYVIFWEGPINFPLWYLRDLICMFLLSPLFYMYFKNLKIYGLYMLILCYLLGLSIDIPGFSMTSILFFGLGAYTGIFKKSLLTFCRRCRYVCGMLTVILLCLSLYYNRDIHYEFLIRPFILCGIVTAINIVFVLNIESKKMTTLFCKLYSCVFFIYAIHTIYIINWTKGLFVRLFPQSNAYELLVGYFSIPVITLCICLLLYWTMKKSLPRVLAFMTGGRI